MSENYNQIYYDEKTINLIDLCSNILKKWRTMVIIAFVLAVAAAGFTYLKSNKEYDANKNLTTSEVVGKMELTEEEEEAFQVKLARIKEYQENVDERDYYLANSIKVKLNPNGFYQGKAIYIFSAGSNAEVLKTVESCKAEVFTEDNFAALSGMLFEKADVALLKEVVFTEEEYYTAEAKVELIVQHYNQEDCEKMLEFMVEKMEESLKSLYDKGVKVDSECIDAKVKLVNDYDLMKLSSDMMDARTSAYDALKNLENSMSDKEKQLYMMDYESETVEEVLLMQKPSVDLKIVIIAAFLGAFAVAGIYAVIYLFSGVVHTKDELESWTNIPVFDMKESIEMLGAMLTGKAVQNGAKKIYLTGSLKGLNDDLKTQLKNLFIAENLEVMTGESILKDAKALQEAADCGYMLLLEKCNASKENDIREEIMKANSCGVKVLGIVLEK